jgi:hypothetical protein
MLLARTGFWKALTIKKSQIKLEMHLLRAETWDQAPRINHGQLAAPKNIAKASSNYHCQHEWSRESRNKLAWFIPRSCTCPAPWVVAVRGDFLA